MKFTEFPNIRSFDDIKSFFKNNKKVLSYLDQYEGQDNFLGSGTKGKVWQIGATDYCLKITSDPDEIKISKELSDGNSKGFLKIFSTVEVDNYQLKIQELCYPTKWEFIHSPFYPHLYYELNKDLDVESFFQFLRKHKKETENISESAAYNVLELFKRVYEDCEKYGVISQYEYLDVHKDNVMQTSKGELKLVDF